MTPGSVRDDPLEVAYRTIDRLTAVLRGSWTAVHAGHWKPDGFWPLDEELCTHIDCTYIGRALKP